MFRVYRRRSITGLRRGLREAGELRRTFAYPKCLSHIASARRAVPGLLSESSSRSSSATSQQMDLGRHFYLNKVLEQYASRPATRMTLRQLVFFGRTLGRDREKILKSANYVRQELAVRIAHRIRDLQALPFVVMTNAHLEEVYEKYWMAFETFRKIPMIRTMEDNENFCETLKRLLEDHLTIIPSLTIGVVESSQHLSAEQLDGFMERMLRSRISRRVLAEQHIALSEALDDPFHFFNEGPTSTEGRSDGEGDHIGIIYTRLKVSTVIEKVAKLLTEIFEEEVRSGLRTGDAAVIPPVIIDGAVETRFAYIPEHLEYIFFELLKNSMTAVMRVPVAMRDAVTIRATIVEGPPDEDLIIRVSDCGGGLPDSVTKLQPIVKREHRRRNIHRHSPRKRREVLDDESVSRRPGISEASDMVDPVTMDSTLSEDSGTHLAPALDRDGGREIDIAMSHARHSVGPTPRDATIFGTGSGATANSAGEKDRLVTAITSFSNVRRRLEIEAEVLRKNTQTVSSHQRQQSSLETTAAETPTQEKEALGLGFLATTRGTGIDSLAKMDALRSVGRFKGTVAEQLSSSTQQSMQTDTLTHQAFPEGETRTAANALASIPSTCTRLETGLGLPMTKIYTDFFGGSLSLRSLDGNGLDVYVRLPKLGTNKEAIEEIVL